ncbi:Dabb family protein [Candidatus Woesearchaeota archaeon]|nr:Dabb family protein [Candidatus Woesearchaeota archaeon]
MSYERVLDEIEGIRKWYIRELAPESSQEETDGFLGELDSLEDLLEHDEFSEAKAIVKSQERYFRDNNYLGIMDNYKSLREGLETVHAQYNKKNQDGKI